MFPSLCGSFHNCLRLPVKQASPVPLTATWPPLCTLLLDVILGHYLECDATGRLNAVGQGTWPQLQRYTLFFVDSGSATVNFSSQVPKIIRDDTFTLYFRWQNKNLHESWFEGYKHLNIQDSFSGPKLK